MPVQTNMQPSEAQFKDILSQALNSSISTLEWHSVGGGSINDTYRLTVNKKLKLFCKLNSAGKFPGFFEKEKHGLELLGSQAIFRIPGVIAHTITNDQQILVLEWVEQGLKTAGFWTRFGEQLAKLHRVSNDQFGLYEDNYMGALPQSNDPSPSWTAFLIHRRFEPQLAIALEKGLLETAQVQQFEKLYKKLDDIFPPEKPSLLHGDLWSGNFLCDENSYPVLIDPAVYFGHRSMDLAMTTLFGGFDEGFYEAYHHHFPLPSNHREQWAVCNLYPLLIHLNLFGRGYLGEILQTIRSY
jgi:fructosamine-3-kinase